MSSDADDLQDLINDFVTESREHLSTVETDLLLLEEGTGTADTVNNVFRCVHSVKGVAGFLGLETIQALSHALESTLDLVRKERLEPGEELVGTLLRAIDGLATLIEDVQGSNDADVSDHIDALKVYLDADGKPEADRDDREPTATATSAATPPTDAPAAAGAPAEVAADEPAATGPANSIAAATAPAAESAPESAAPTPEAGPGSAATAPAARPAADPHKESIRVSVDLLNRLMNLSGEMVLGRNQVLQSIRPSGDRGLHQAVTNLSQVVSEMQEAIMQTRLQPVGNVFQKFPRIVRDLANKLGKKCRLTVEGKDVELDRSILEALGDPLTHLVRNALDHGIESPAARRNLDKPVEGTLHLQASHQGGNVKIKIIDDGAGIDPDRMRKKATEKRLMSADQASALSDRDAVMLIFAPGFSTAEAVSDVSGRGVGMDVVRSNIEKLGGHVDVQSGIGNGTTLTITIPLTLAIVPALIVTCAKRRYVIPQNNVTELVRVRAGTATERIVRVRGREVLRLRGELLPIIRLSEALGVTNETGEGVANNNIVVVQSGAVHYGLVIDSPPDTEEIVVKPLGTHLRKRSEYSGSTILGDGAVALILDVAGVAIAAGLRPDEAGDDKPISSSETRTREEATDFVIFRCNAEELFAVPLGLVSRIKRVRADQIVRIGDELVHRLEDSVMPVVRLSDHVSALELELDDDGYSSLLVLRILGTEFAIETAAIEDIRTISVQVDNKTLARPGIVGSIELNGRTVRIVDVSHVARTAIPQLVSDEAENGDAGAARPDRKLNILLAEDSGFFRTHVTRVIKQGGFTVAPCEDGNIAWQRLDAGSEEFDLVVTDVQMPNCDGIELTQRIRADSRFSRLPIVMLSSLSNEEDIAAGHRAGATDYLIKMDDQSLIAALRRAAGVNQ